VKERKGIGRKGRRSRRLTSKGRGWEKEGEGKGGMRKGRRKGREGKEAGAPR